MKRTNLPSTAKRLMLLVMTMFYGLLLWAQAPSSLSYPTGNYFIANETNVYLAPSVAGNVSTYSILPALPAGLIFNTSTGVISGVATAATPGTTPANYTITANAVSPATGTTTFTTTIQVFNSYFNNQNGGIYGNLNFGGTGVSVYNANQNSGSASDNQLTQNNGYNHGSIANNKVLYRNVRTIGSTQIDCIVTTVSVVANSLSYDSESTSGATLSANSPRFFTQLCSFANNNSTFTAGGSAIFNFQFILGGSYNHTNNSFVPVTLQNVQVNTYDIDGNDNSEGNFSAQSNSFEGFTVSERGQNTTILAPVLDGTLTRYRSGTDINRDAVTSDITRVRLTYNNLSNFTWRIAGGGTAYFFLDFSSGPTFSTAVPTAPPSIDLNTNTGATGVNNGSQHCGTAFSFSQGAALNVTGQAGSALTQLDVSYKTASIQNGADEKIYLSGATGGANAANPLLLNASSFTSPNLSLAGISGNFTAAISTNATTNIRTIVFAKTSSGTFTLTEAEALVDALRYTNTAAVPVNGDREFSVSTRTTAFISPTAIFTADVNCVQLSGHIYHDRDGMLGASPNNNMVNASGTQFSAGDMYAVLTNPSTGTNANVIQKTAGIATNGQYTFGTISPGAYNIYFVPAGSLPVANNSNTLSASIYPTGTSGTYNYTFISTGENLGASAGNDGLTDGKLTITLGSESITQANFGLQIPPKTQSTTFASRQNPGNFNYYNIPDTGFTNNITEVDGSITTLTIKGFPTNTNVLKIGTTVYKTASSTCPPLTTCVDWPVSDSVNVPFAQIGQIAIDPIGDYTVTPVITYSVTDNGGAKASFPTNSTITIPFFGEEYAISGKVWNDANGDGSIAATGEPFTAGVPATATSALYAVLIQTNNTYNGTNYIYATTPVNATNGEYTFNAAGGNTYSVRLVQLNPTSLPLIGSAATGLDNPQTGTIGANWVGVSINSGGTTPQEINPGVTNPSIAISNLTANRTLLNFGIEQKPTAVAITTSPAYANDGGNALFVVGDLRGSDPEDFSTEGSLSGKTIVITSLATGGTLYYGSGATPPAVTLNQVITSYDPALLKVNPTGTGNTNVTFQYVYQDNAGERSTPVTAATPFTDCVPASFDASPVNATVCNGGNTTFSVTLAGTNPSVKWQSSATLNGTYTDIVASTVYSGVNTTTLTITGATSAINNRYYQAVASNQCMNAAISIARQLTVISPISSIATTASCFGLSTGTATVAPGNGSNHTYAWSSSAGNQTTATATALPASTLHTVTVSVNAPISCSSTQNVTITQPTAEVSGSVIANGVTCFGGNNGTINLTPSGGTPASTLPYYTYNWGGTPTVTTEDRTGLIAGVYSVTITDANGCSGTLNNISVLQPSAVSGSTTVTNATCFGGATGTINLTPSGGSGSNYTYNWGGTPAITTEDRTGLLAGAYTVVVTDGVGCSGTVNATVNQPTGPVSGTAVITSVSCFGGNNGAINLTPTGGSGSGYTFNWGGVTPITTEDRTGLPAGNYTVVVTDGVGCTGTVNVTVTQPTNPVSGTTVVTNVSCFNGDNGAINLTPTGGTGSGYTFNWGGVTPITTEDRVNLAAGNYAVTITDANGCTGIVNETVTQPTNPVSGTALVTNVSCFGGNNGTINLTPSGGTGTHTFNWSDNKTTEDRTVLVAGTYGVTITDANGCTVTLSNIEVTQPDALSAANMSHVDVLCYGTNTGSITVAPTGGTPNYTYAWSPSGGTAATATGLAEGTYTVTVTDNKQCQTTATATVLQNPPIAYIADSTVLSSQLPFNFGPSTNLQSIAAAGTTTHVFKAANNCDSTVTLNLTVTPVSIAGGVYHDADGGSNRIDNGAVTNLNLTAVLYKTGADTFTASKPLINGAFTFDNVRSGSYSVLITNNTIVGNTLPNATLPIGWINTGEALATGNIDGSMNGIYVVGTLNNSVADIRFGIQQLPTVTQQTLTTIGNPGGLNQHTLPSGSFTTNDDDGTVTDIRITTMPTNINAITIGTTTYLVSGGTCPLSSPATCVAWPNGGVTIPTTAMPVITIDPLDGNQDVVITFEAKDNAGFWSSNTQTTTVPFRVVAVSGIVWNDGDSSINKNGSEPNYSGTDVYAYLINAANQVIGKSALTGGAYTIGAPIKTSGLDLIISTSDVAVGANKPLGTLPDNWVYTGAVGGALNHIALVTVETAITDRDFGIQQLPTVADKTIADVSNPGGFNNYTVPSGSFLPNDADGTVTNITVTNFPINANSITLNGTTYVSAPGVCVTCTPWTGPVTVVVSANNPTGNVMVDPIDGNIDVTIKYTSTDNAGFTSADTADLIIQFRVITTAGYVWADGNASLVAKQNHERLVSGNAGTATSSTVISTGASLFATLLDAGDKVIQSVAVAADGTYVLTYTPTNSNNLKVILSTNEGTIGGDAPIIALPVEWVNIGEVGNTMVQTATLGTINLSSLAANINNQNFAINKLPKADALNVPEQVNPGGTIKVTVPALAGYDAEDGDANGILNGTSLKNKIVINTLPSASTGVLYYNNIPVTVGQVIPVYNPALLTVDPASGAQIMEFTFSQIDSADKQSTIAALVTIPFRALTIAGTVLHDINGLQGTPVYTVDGTGTNPGGLNAVLYSAGGTVLDVQAVNTNGTFSFTNKDGGNYNVLITTNTAIIGQPVPAVTLPFGWVSTGEFVGSLATAGSDGVADGRIILGNITNNVPNVKFGIEQLPFAGNNTISNIANPGGHDSYTLPNASFAPMDLDGTIIGLTVNSFPINTNTITLNGTTYISTFGTCPGGTTCTLWPGAVYVPVDAAGNPVQPVSVDPVDGNTQVAIKYTAMDNAGRSSILSGTVSLNFVVMSVAGQIWADGNATLNKEAHERLVSGTSAASLGVTTTGTNLYATLMGAGNKIIQSVQVGTDGTYVLNNVPPNSTGLKVILSVNTGAVGANAPAIALPAAWVNIGELAGAGNGAAGSQSTTLGQIELNTATTNINGLNFAINNLPIANALAVPGQINPGGSVKVTVPALTGSDQEDGVYNGINLKSRIKINTLPDAATGVLYYNDLAVSSGQEIVAYNPALLKVDPASGPQVMNFTFSEIDSAGKQSLLPAQVTLPFTTISIGGIVLHDANGLNGTPVNTVDGVGTNAGGLNAVLYSGSTVLAVQALTGNGLFNFTDREGGDYSIMITTATATVGQQVPAVTLPNGWVSTGEFVGALNAPGNDLAQNGILSIGSITASINNAKFGIERLPTAIAATTTVPLPTIGTLFTLNGNGSNPPVPTATDPEDGTLAAGKTIVITSLPNNSNLLYNGTAVTTGQVITGFVPAQLQVQVTAATVGSSSTSFTFNYQDAAGKTAINPATYTLDWGTVLPVKMGDFTARAEGDKARLDWETYTEQNNKGFYIERSKDGRNWKEIGFTATLAENGNSNEALVYTAYDNVPMAGLNHYRLRQVDNDGKPTYSEVRELNFVFAEHKISVYPNPATDRVHLKVMDWSTIKAVLMLDVNGREVYRSKHDEAQAGIDMHSLADGTYLIVVEQTNNRMDRFKVVKKQ